MQVAKCKPLSFKKGKGNLANQFCICETLKGANIPVVAIELGKLSVGRGC